MRDYHPYPGLWAMTCYLNHLCQTVNKQDRHRWDKDEGGDNRDDRDRDGVCGNGGGNDKKR